MENDRERVFLFFFILFENIYGLKDYIFGLVIIWKGFLFFFILKCGFIILLIFFLFLKMNMCWFFNKIFFF